MGNRPKKKKEPYTGERMDLVLKEMLGKGASNQRWPDKTGEKEPFTKLLAQIRPAFSKELLNEEGYKRISLITSLLPLDFTYLWGIECRMEEGEGFADILFELDHKSLGLPYLSGDKPSSLDQLCHSWPQWGRLRSFTKNWLNPTHGFYHHIRCIWLEFDMAEAKSQKDLQKAIKEPNFFFSPKEETSHENIMAMTKDLIAHFSYGEPSLTTFKSFLDYIPCGSKVWMLALMLTREEETGLRLCVNKVVPDTIKPWFWNLFPKEESEMFFSLICKILPMTKDISYVFNLTPKGVELKIGLECFIHWQQRDPDHYPPLIKFFMHHGLCAQEKVKKILEYGQLTASQLKKHLPNEDDYIYTSRKNNHVKCILAKGQITQVKVYPAVYRLPLADFLRNAF